MLHVGGLDPGDFGGLGGLGRRLGEWAAAEYGGDDSCLHVLVEAGQALDLDLGAGFLGDLAAHSLFERLVCFPIPPELVGHLAQHLDRWGSAPDGRLFASSSGAVVGSGTYTRVWSAARRLALPPSMAASAVAGRPYDLRHAAVSLWLNAGVPAIEVAERAGHSVEVLLKVYAKCIDGQRATINGKIDGVLG